MGRNDRYQKSGKKFFKRKNFNENTRSKDKTYTYPEQLAEIDVGIAEYLSDLDGFSGVIKARFSDFQLNEINLDGEIAKLTNTEVPSEFKVDRAKKKEPIPETTPCDAISQEIWTKILNLMQGQEENCIEIDATNFDKDKRSIVHNTVKKVFKKEIVAQTILKDDKKLITFKKYCDDDRRHFSEPWPEGVGEYVHFLVYKENIDTLETTLKISDCLKMKSSLFTYAGVKDRRSKSTQWFCVKKVEPWKLIFKTKCLRNIHIGNISFKNKTLKLGQLKGNRFRIALRNITGDDNLINAAMESLNAKGFINYYGLQRFGNNKEVPTYEIGLQLLLGNFKEACNLILKCKKDDHPSTDTTQAKTVYKETGDAVAASKCFKENDNRCVESKLLLGLAKSNKNDYVNALESIPRNMRLLYIHAFQGLIWNRIVSKRIKEFGQKLIVGDLVLINEELCNPIDDVSNTENEKEGETHDEENGKEKIGNKQEVKILTAEDLEKYTINDLVLPLPGYDITYPENIVKNWYKEILEQYGFTLEMTKQKVKTYTLSGSYRRLFEQVTDLKWKIVHYKDPNDNLILSDFEEMLGRKEPADQPDGKYKALIIDFGLKSSCYATMVIREILKTDTSSSSQAKLNNYHEAEKPMTMKTETIGANPESLLSDPDKFEAFKRNVFGDSGGDSLKRKCLDDVTEMQAKKSKDDTENTNEISLKLEPSLV